MRLEAVPYPPDTAVKAKPKSSPAKSVAIHLVNLLCRPTRIRRRAIWSAFALTGVLFLIIERRHADDLQLTVSTLGGYVPYSISDAISHYGEVEQVEQNRWDDVVDPNSGSSVKKPKFHLLIPTPDTNASANLCKTLMSAAILNYPPPTLIHYGDAGGAFTRPGADIVRNVFSFLLGKEAHDDDLILVVEQESWFQLPAEVAVNRFFHGLQDSNELLLKQYGQNMTSNETANLSTDSPKYTQKVLFGAQKQCSNPRADPACNSVPQSSLPKDIYGPQTDRHPSGRYNRPHFMDSNMVMGRVSDLLPIFKLATELLEFEDIGKYGSQHIFSQLFGEQEYHRALYLNSIAPKSRWRQWMNSKTEPSNTPPPVPGRNYELGIGLDYASSIFQIMDNSAKDVKSMRFDNASIIASPSKLSAASFKTPPHLPPDLTLSRSPFSLHQVSAPNPSPPFSALDNLPEENISWAEIQLATNLIIPGSSVPAMLDYRGEEGLMRNTWREMWYFEFGRALMRQYIRSPQGPIAASSGDKWWDLRGGKGGVWDERGEWREWMDVCAGTSDELFGDGKGLFGMEDESVGGEKPVHTTSGERISGQDHPETEAKSKEEGLARQKHMGHDVETPAVQGNKNPTLPTEDIRTANQNNDEENY
ncbi:hypothetical protein LHYA1_G005093, partial [Lachnellula hyalina]